MIRILVADDSKSDADLELRALRDAGLEFEHQIVWTEDTFRRAVANFSPDIVLCDFQFPNFDGPLALEILREISPATPLIFVSGTVSEERAALATQLGAADYVLKSNLVRLPGAVERAVARGREERRRRDAEQRVRQLSRTKDMLAAVNAAIIRRRDRNELFGEACRIAVEVGGFSYSFIMTLDDDNRVQLPVLLGSHPYSAEQMLARVQHLVDTYETGPGAVAQSIRTHSPGIVNNLPAHPEIADQPTLIEAGINAVASFPLLQGERMTGAMVVASYQSRFFNDEEVTLLASLTNNLAFALDLMDKQARLDYLSYYDPLTELANRSLFIERLRQTLAASREGERVAVMLIDIHQFAQLNARLGPTAGDDLLQQIGERLRAAIGADNLARFPGDRFAAMFPPSEDLQPVIDALDESGIRFFAPPFVSEGRAVNITVRAGCAVFPQDGNDPETLTRHAEVALENARHTNAPYRFYSPDLDLQMEARVDLEARLQRALEQSQFILYYQPKVDVASREITGIEALIRWRDPERPGELVGPVEFIPVLEQTGLIVAVGRWVLHAAARQYVTWSKAGRVAPRIAVNLSPRQLSHPGIVADVRSAVESCGGMCGIDLEVTESMLMEHAEEATAKLNEMRALGLEISLDDFGTGYSSLSRLQQLPISTIKIDRSFVHGMTDNANKTTMISTIISMAQSLHLKVVAEGVESEEQARLLRLLRCDQMQGFLIARPSPPEHYDAML
ncbi:MAG TPA: EAL domain-containing protein [Verrucomicrobiae bacterium]|nr:EAL domain-containing protein [Verrucomicrobiae bacterium]